MSITVENIGKNYGVFRALDRVSLDFPTGRLTALLGPSGCGKTTLLRIIAGLESADEGRVLLNGIDASDTELQKRNVGFVFQHYALFRHMTIFENVAFGLRMRPRKFRPTNEEIKKRVMTLLELVQLDWVADRYPPQLSGGQRQRIALARALAVEPRVLLLDEPFGALDAKVRKELRRWLRRLHDDFHVTSIFVTHDQEEALEVADQVVLMNKGRVEQVGSPEEVYKHPASPFAYSFIGAVNLFRGRSGENGPSLADETAPFEARDGDVVAFVRPHEIRIMPDGTGGGGIPAKVARIQSFGLTAHVDLYGVKAAEGQTFEAEILKEEADRLALEVGKPVRLFPSDHRFFEWNAAANQI